jgi:ubiquinone/menaquinone biosynthesis C-methylase UbiE
MSNKSAYESAKLVNYYGSYKELKPPEKAILQELGNKLSNMRMLDVGVGGGRTTLHFANLVKEYVGVDYSKNMIDCCKSHFQGKNVSFRVADATSLNEFKRNYFDFVLFSYNGLDYVPHKARTIALKEMKRVLKKKGLFAFSTHNLNGIENIYSTELSQNPIKLWRSFKKQILVFVLNGFPNKFKNANWAIINDGAHDFKLKTHYITPVFQVKQLKQLGFKNIRAYSSESGNKIDKSKITKLKDTWIYYACNK